MRPLVLCQACKRHVKSSDAQCPFCGTGRLSAAVATRVDAPERSPAPRGRGVPGGRAALFLAGSVLGAGCADEVAVPVYGVAIDGGLDDVEDAGAKQDGGRDAEAMGSPVYGVAIDSGLMATPPYGVAVPDAGVDAAVTDASCPRFG